MIKENKQKFRKLLKGGFIALALLITTTVPVCAASKTISTDRGNMEAWSTGFYLSATKEKGMEFGSEMKSGKTTRLYLKANTVNYSTGSTAHTVKRWGGSGRTQINDYFYLKGYSSTKLKTYTTHEAIYTNAHTVQLSEIY